MNYKYLASLEKFGINFGLDRIKELLENLGNPQLKFKSIHVAGTNGKGSTCAMIASILKEAGYKTGLYTSPHLIDYTERIKINGRDIPKAEFIAAIKKVKQAISQLDNNLDQPTVFEVLTAAAFWLFAKKKVDFAVIEVGMGGRLDATNVITPLVSVITNIDFEHTAILGNTLTKIAFEKAAIIKPGIPVVTAEEKKEPLVMIKRTCEENGSALVKVETVQPAMRVKLIGDYQKVNAACAVAAIRLAGIKIPKKAIAVGLMRVNWPARLQIISHKPLTIIDGAHNPAGIKSFLKAIKFTFSKRKFTFVIGIQKDKDWQAMLKAIKPFARRLVFTRSSNPNAAPVITGKNTYELKHALGVTSSEDRIITGSLYLAGDALKCLDLHGRA